MTTEKDVLQKYNIATISITCKSCNNQQIFTVSKNIADEFKKKISMVIECPACLNDEVV